MQPLQRTINAVRDFFYCFQELHGIDILAIFRECFEMGYIVPVIDR